MIPAQLATTAPVILVIRCDAVFFFLGIFILLYVSFQCHKNFTAMSHNIGETFQ